MNNKQPPLDLAQAHIMHFKSMVCMALDPSQPPAFTGSYPPKIIAPDYLRVLQTHTLFSRFCHVEQVGDQQRLWLKHDWESEWSVYQRAKQESAEARAARIEDEKRTVRAIDAYFNLQQRAKNYRCTRANASDMVMQMIDAHKSGESGFDAMLQKIGYLNETSA